jgi:phosphohistidine phosphatase SixA
MKQYFILLITLLHLHLTGKCQEALQAPPAAAITLTKIFIVRHADRLPADDLSPAGVVRANELRRVLGQAKIDSIFSTDFTRTKKTAKPLALLMGLPTIIYSNAPAVINRILTNSKGKRVVVVGHSDTVDDLIQACGCIPPPAITPNIPETQFDNLLQVLVQKVVVNGQTISKCEVIHMKYGAVTN